MTDNIDIPPEERYQLLKLHVLREVEADLTSWAKSRGAIFAALLAVVGFFGAGGFISLTVGNQIAREMEVVDSKVLEAVRSTVQAELSAKMATELAEVETRKVTLAAERLNETVTKIKSEAEKIEKQLDRFTKGLDSQSENVRGEARLLVEGLERRVANLEVAARETLDSSSEVLKSVDELEQRAEREKAEYTQNSKITVQFILDEADSSEVDRLETILRKEGYKTAQYFSLSTIERNWGVTLESLGVT